mgnify:CR=1 FL=1
MAYTEKFQTMADAARAAVTEVQPEDVDALIAKGAIALDIRDPDEHAAGHIAGSVNISRGKLEMNVEGQIADHPVLLQRVQSRCAVRRIPQGDGL